ncbi:hypothetical protein N0V88_005345 [Collariella sp. IMI 366227]|nr:hypothetical protein N0V88_005345 [Collariella sp. IMI 366227]
MAWIQSNSRNSQPASGQSSSASTQPTQGVVIGLNPKPTATSTHRLKPATKKLTMQQFLYILILQGIGAMIIAGGINFAVGYVLYPLPTPPSPHSSSMAPLAPHRLRLYDAHQSLITWFTCMLLINRDLTRGAIAPTPSNCLYDPSTALDGVPHHRFSRWLYFLDHYNAVRGSCQELQQWSEHRADKDSKRPPSEELEYTIPTVAYIP